MKLFKNNYMKSNPKIVCVMLLYLLICISIPAYASINNGLVGYYPLNGNANDSSNYGNHGAINSATATTDRFGNSSGALYFDGVDDYVQINTSSSLDTRYSISIFAWINYQGTTDGPIVQYGSDAWGVHFWTLATNNSLYFKPTQRSDTGQPVAVAYNNGCTGNAWKFVGGTYDYSTGIAKLYVDGVQVASLSVGQSEIGTQYLIRFGNVNFDARKFKGKIDDVRIYNRALSDEDAAQLYNESKPETNNALSFDGTDDSVNLGTNIANYFSGRTAITIEYWFKGTVFQSPVRIQDVTGQFIVAGWAPSNPVHIISTDGDTSGVSCGDVNVITDGSWHHLAMTWQKNTTNGFKSYLDGVLVQQRNSANVNLPVLTNDRTFLGSLAATGEYINGQLDEVRIWDVVRTQSEILENMYTNLQGNESGLYAYYRFNQSSGATLEDLSGNNTHGTLTNMDTNNAWVTGYNFMPGSGNALTFDGTDDYVQLQQNYTWPTSFSTMAWIYLEDYSGQASIFSAGQISGSATNSLAEFRIYQDKLQYGQLYDATWEHVTSYTTFAQNKWYHVAVVKNASTVTLFINGEIDNSGSISNTLGYNVNAAIGNLLVYDAPSADYYFKGKIDEISFWSTTLSQNDIQNYMNQHLTGSETGLLQYYRFDHESGIKLANFAGNGNDGTLINMDNTDWVPSDVPIITSPVAGKGNALHFDGVDDYVQVPGDSNLRPSQITIEAWIKADSWGANYWDGTIVSTESGGGNGYALRCGNNGKLDFLIGHSNVWYQTTTDEVMSLNTWHHLASTFDGTTLTIYIDGIEIISESPANAALGYIGSEALQIGDSCAYTGRYFHGKIDDVRIWNYVRSQTDIQRDMYNILDGNETGLMGYWRFDQTSGRIAIDSSQNYLHGTLINMDSSDWLESMTSYTFITGKNESYTMFAGYAPDNDSLSLTALSGPSNGTISFNTSTNIIEYTPNTNFFGYDPFTYQLSDGVESDNFTIDMNVAPPGSGNALTFDGVDDYIDLSTGVWFNGDFTVESWIYLRNYGNFCRLIDVGAGSESGADNIIIALSDGTGGKPNFHIYNGATETYLTSSEQIPLNQWVHLAAISSGSDGYLYMNGRLVASNNSMYQALNVVRQNAYIGKSNWSVDAYSNMKIDEFRIWSVARTKSEIRQNMCQKLSGTETGLMLYYRFDHQSVSAVFDLSGNNLHGTLSNMDSSDWLTSTAPIGDISVYDYNDDGSYALPGSGRALSFDAVDDYVDLGSRSELILGNTFTIEAWIYSTVPNTNYFGFIGNQGGTTTDRSPSMWIYNQTQIHYDLYNETSTSCGDMSGNMISSNQWIHIALVHDGTTLNLYANGINQYTSTACSGFDLKDIPINFIGKVDNWFSGYIDEVRLWNIARNESQIQNSMNAKLTGNETGLVAYYRFDSTSGNTLYDSSGNDYHGTLMYMTNDDWISSNVPFFDPEVSLTINNWATIKSKGNDGLIKSIHLYAVNESPNITDNPSAWQSMDTSHYFGVFTDGSSQAYSITYDYSNHSNISTENIFKLASRLDAADSTWTDINASVNVSQSTLSQTNISYDTATEFVFGFYHAPPEISTIASQASTNNIIGFTITNASDTQLTVTVSSSDSSIVSYTGLYFAGSGSYTQIVNITANVSENLTLTLTPMANQHGRITITIMAENSNGTWSSTAFSVIVSPPGAANALYFNGTTDKVDLGTISGAEPLALAGSTFTFSFWIKPTDGDTYPKIIDKSDGYEGKNGYSVQVKNSGYILLQIAAQNRYESETGVIIEGVWQHVAITGDGTTYTCYVNGSAVSGTYPNAYASPPNADCQMMIGHYTGLNRAYKGLVDELRIWNRALSLEEIRQNMCQRLAGTENGLVLYYRFDNITGTTVRDLSGNEYHGTFMNMDDTNWQVSGASIGDTSTYDYTGSVASDFTANLSHSDGDSLTVTGESGTYNGIHLYLVNESPTVSSLPGFGWSSFDTTHYWGVFPVGTNNTYSITYNYSENSYVSNENKLSLAGRHDNSSARWVPIHPQVTIESNTLSQSGLSTYDGISVREIIAGSLNSKPFAGSGNAIHFDGTNDYISINNSNELSPAQITIEAWIKADSWKTNHYEGTILATEQDASGNYYGYVLRCGANGTLDFVIGNTNTWLGATTAAIMSANTWHHLAATFDGTTMKVYIDGVERASSSPSGAALNYYGNEVLTIGDAPKYTGRYFHGTMDDIRIWNVARSQTNIQEDMYQTLSGTEAGLVGYWRFDQDSGTDVYDTTNYLHHGTFNNMDTSDWVESTLTSIFTINENTSFTCVAGHDDDGDSLTLTTLSAPSNGVATFNQANNVITYTPTEDYYGTDELIYQLTDGSNADNHTITFHIENVNDWPDIAYDDHQYALSFDGSNDFINVGNIPLANQSFTIEFWAKRDSSDNWDVIVGQGSETDNNNFHIGFRDSNVFTLGFGNNDLNTSATYTDNNWHHWAATYDINTMTQTIYRDGIAVASRIAGANYGGTGGFIIGRYGPSETYHFDGSLDELRIWNQARTQTQIQDHMYATVPYDDPTLSAYYQFNHTSGATLPDLSGNNYNGTLTNMDTNACWESSIAPVQTRPIVSDIENALSFDGVDDHVDIGNINLANQSFSVEFWARRASIGSAHMIVGQGSGSTNNGLHIGFRDTNEFTCAFYGNDLNSPQYTDTEWHHWAVTYDSNTKSKHIYRDGNCVASHISSSNYLGSGNMYLGIKYEPASYFIGDIDELRIWNDERNQTEIRQHMYQTISEPDASLIAYYQFNQEETLSLPDISTNNNDGTLINMDASNDWIPSNAPINRHLARSPQNAILFDGVNDYLNLGNIDLANKSFTIEFWTAHLAHNEFDMVIYQGGACSTNTCLHIGFRASNVFTCDFISNAVETTTKYSDSDWHHWAVTFNASSKARVIYRDGHIVASDISSSNYLGSGDFIIGKYQSTPFYNGKLDELRIWNVARTQSEIVDHMNQPLVGNETGLLAYYTFDQQFISHVVDHAGQNYPGKFENMESFSDIVKSSAKIHDNDGPGGIGSSNGLSDLKVWLKAHDISGLSNGDSLSIWTDLSGWSHSASQTSTTHQPQYQTNQINGYPVVSFFGYPNSNGGADFDYLNLGITNFSPGKALSVYIVGKVNTDGAHYFWGRYRPRLRLSNKSFECDRYSNTSYNTDGTAPGSFSIISMDATDSSATIKWNGEVQSNPSAITTANLIETSEFWIGAAQSNGYSSLNGAIAEIVVYGYTLNSAQQIILDNYLSAKYAISLTSDKYDGDLSGFDKDVAGIGKSSDGSHILAESAGLILRNHEFLTDNGDYVMAGHSDSGSASLTNTTNDLPSNMNHRLSRIWYIDRTDGAASANGNMVIAFDFGKVGLSEMPLEPENYSLLYRTGTSGTFSVVQSVTVRSNDDCLYFEISENELVDGYYTFGWKSISGAGNALSFDGIDDYVESPYNESLNPDVFTVSIWAKVTGGSGNFRSVLTSRSNGSKGYLIYAKDTNIWSFWFGNGSVWINIDASAVVLNQWTHLAMTCNGNKVIGYINGVQIGQNTGFSRNTSQTFRLGAGDTEQTTPNYYFPGQLDEFRFYNVVLSQADIRDVMCQKLTQHDSRLVAYYRFDQSSGSTLLDLSGKGLHAPLFNMDDSAWVLSGAPLGDISVYDYNNNEISLTIENRTTIQAKGNSGTLDCIHLYTMNQSPNNTTPPNNWLSLDTTHSFGVFTAGTNETYSISYDYSSHPEINQEDTFILSYRSSNADSSWEDLAASVDTTADTIEKTNISIDTAQEFILGMNYIPSMSAGMDQSINEDAQNQSFSLTVTDSGIAECSMSVTIVSSNESLISSNSVTYTCDSGLFNFSFTPTSDQYGLAEISITIADGGGLTASTSFSITVISINDAPVIDTISDETVEGNTTLESKQLTVTDAETAICSLVLTYTSSDTSLISAENISYTCGTSGFYFSFTPTTDQTGITTISFTITDGGSLTATTSFDLTVSVFNAAPIIGAIADQITSDDVAIQSIPLTVTDETATCSLGVSITSSNTGLIGNNNISYTCSAETVYLSLTPTLNQYGQTSISISITDTEGLTRESSFTVTIVGRPTISYTYEVIDCNINYLRGGPSGENPVAIPVQIAVIAPAGIYANDLNAWTSSGWRAPQAFYDRGPFMNDPDRWYDDVSSYGTTWTRGDSNGKGILVVDMQTPKSINRFSVFQMFSDGKTTHFRFYRHSSTSNTPPDYTDGGWIPVINETLLSAGARSTDSGGYVYDPTKIELTEFTSRYLKIETRNDGTYSYTSYIEFKGVKAFGVFSGSFYEDTSTNLAVQLSNPQNSPLTITVASSNVSLVSDENITLTGGSLVSSGSGYTMDVLAGAAEDLTLTVTPEANANGTLSITMTVTNVYGLTAVSAIPLTIIEVNDSPQIGTVDDQTIIQNTTHSVSLTVNDLETQACNLTINIDSSNTSLIPVANISYTCTAKTLYFSLTPLSDQHGTSTISITALDDSNLTNTTTFLFNVMGDPEISYTPTITEGTINQLRGGPSGENPVAIPVQIAVISPAVIYANDLNAWTSSGWRAPQALYDRGPFMNDPDKWYDDVSSYGSTWTRGDSTGKGILVVDMQSPKSINRFSVFQMFSDGKTTHVRFYKHSSTSNTPPDYTDGGWIPVINETAISAGVRSTDSGGYVYDPTKIEIDEFFSRYLKIEARNDGSFGSTSYIELKGVKAFGLITGCFDEGTSTELAVEFSNPQNSPLTITVESSNTSLVADENLVLTGSGLVSVASAYTLDTIATVAQTMSLTVIPDENASGNFSITITSTNVYGLSAVSVIPLTIVDLNDLPTIGTIDNQTMDQNTSLHALSFTATDIETDECNLGLTFTSSDTALIPVENISYTCNSGVFYLSLTPSTNQSGSATITVTITDENNGSMSEAFGITVNEVIDLSLGLVVYYEFENDTQDSSSNNYHAQTSGTIAYEPGMTGNCVKLNGTDSYLYRSGIDDLQELSISLFFKIESLSHTYNNLLVFEYPNDELVMLFTENNTQLQLEMKNLGSISVTDPLNYNQFYHLIVLNDYSNSKVSIYLNGQLIHEISEQHDFITNDFLQIGCENEGLYLYNGWVDELRIYDRILSTDEIEMLINHSPSIGSIADQVTDEEVAITAIPLTSTDSETAICNLDITYTFSNITLFSQDNVSYTCDSGMIYFSFTPTTNQSGNTNVSITLTDAGNLTATTSFAITVNAINDAPVIGSIADQITNEDTAISAINFIATDIETVSCSMAITFGSSDTSLISVDHISYTCDSGILFISLTPTTDQNGNATISITVTDGGNLTAATSFAITVNAINDAPVIGTIADQTINEESVIISIPVTATDNDTAGCSLEITIASSNTSLVAENNISYTCDAEIFYISLTPTYNQFGNAVISLTISDGSLSDSTAFELTVNEINDAPVLTGNTEVTLDEDTTASFSVTATDAEIAGCSLSITYHSSDITLLPIENISKTCRSNEFSFMITPIANQSGNALLTITVADTSGLTASKIISLTVNAVNDIPIIDTIDSQIMNEGSAISVTMTASDIEGSLTLTGISADQRLISDSNITITNSGNLYTITITPDTAQAGSTEVTIVVSDGTDITTTSFIVSVNEVYYTIAGHVSNYTDISGTHIAGVTMTLSGTHTYTTFTDISGDYTFSTVRPGDYTLTASKTDDISLNLSDAIHILKASVGLESLSCYEKIAADANMNGSVSVYDAAKVAQYVVGNNNCFNDSCVFWRFIPEIITNCETWTLIEIENVRRYTDLSGDALGQDFIGIGCGSVVE